jgi:hypothetical protein
MSIRCEFKVAQKVNYMKKNSQQRLILNIIILVTAAFILLFMVVGKLLSPSEETSFVPIMDKKFEYQVEKLDYASLDRETKNARTTRG